MTLREAVGKVLEGWTLPNSVRKILEEAYFDEPQRTWVGLTDEDKMAFLAQDFGGNRLDAMDWAEKRLKEKNT